MKVQQLFNSRSGTNTSIRIFTSLLRVHLSLHDTIPESKQ